MDVISIKVGMLWMSPTSSKLDVTDSLNFCRYNRCKISHALNFYFFNVREADIFFFFRIFGGIFFFPCIWWIFVFLYWLITSSYFFACFSFWLSNFPGWLIETLYISWILILCCVCCKCFCLHLPLYFYYSLFISLKFLCGQHSFSFSLWMLAFFFFF